jgi:hypothetical protein
MHPRWHNSTRTQRNLIRFNDQLVSLNLRNGNCCVYVNWYKIENANDVIVYVKTR